MTQSKKHKYIVTVPIAGATHIEVEAENASQAKEAAWDKINEGIANDPDANIDWEFLDIICEGNVCHAPVNEIYASKVKDDK